MRTRWIALLFALLLLMGCACAEAEITSASQLNAPNMTVGVAQGSAAERIVQEQLPEAQLMYFNDNPTAYLAVAQGKADAYVYDMSQMRVALEGGVEGVHLLEETVGEPIRVAVGVSPASKVPELRDALNRFIAEVKADGTLEEMRRRWVLDGDEAMPDIALPESPTLHLTVGTSGIVPPYSYYVGTELSGFDIELARRFAAWLGADVQFKVYDYGAIIPACVSGDVDCVMANLNITPERAEALPFSDVLYEEKLGVLVKGEAGAQPKASSDFSAMAGKRIAVQTGTISGEVAQAVIPDPVIDYYNSQADAMAALRTGKADAWATDEPVARFMLVGNADLRIMGRLDTSELAAVFARSASGQALCDQYSAFVEGLWADGTMTEIDDTWFGEDDSRRVLPDYEALPDDNGTLRMALDSTIPPFAYMKDNRVVGYDVDIAARFCAANGYRLEIEPMNFDGVLASVQSGKCDFAACGITVTAERAESVLFCAPTYHSGTALVIAGDAAVAEAKAASAFSALAQLDGKRIGVQTGSTFDEIVLSALPEAKISYFNSYPDMAAALEANKIDGFPGDEPVLRMMAAEDDKLTVLDETMDSFEFGFVLPRTEAGDKLLGEIDAWLEAIKASGELDEVVSKWTDGPEAGKTLPDFAAFPAPNGTLTLATEGAYAPMNYFRGSEVVGFEIDLAARFCEANGYGLRVETMNFDGLLPAVQAGKANFAAAGITITEERAESVNFSAPYYAGGTVMAVLKPQNAASAANAPTSAYASLDELDGKRIGVQTGTSFDKAVSERLPEAEIVYLNNKADLINALTTHKIDAYTVDEPVIKFQVQEAGFLTYIPEYLDSFDFAYIFPQTDEGQALCDQFSEYLRQIKADGTLAEIDRKWFSLDDSVKTLADYKSFPAPNGTLRMATEALYEPFSYILNNEIVGYDIDIAVHFCEAYGYGLEIEDMNFDAVLPSVKTGKCDFGGAGITITAERAESVLFSEPNYSGGTVMAVLKDSAASGGTAQNVRWQDYNGKRLGVLVGPLMEDAAKQYFPDSEILLLSSYPDCITALLTNKIDAYLGDEPGLKTVHAEQPEIDYIHDRITQNNYAFAFRKNDPESEALRDELNEFLARSWADGTMQELEDIWLGVDEAKKLVDMSDLTGENGTIRVITTSTDAPFSYIKDGKNVGYDIDLVVRFCRDRGYALELVDVDFAGRIPALESGKGDFTTDMNVTPEREEQVLFSDPTSYGGIVLAVLSSDLDAAAPQAAAVAEAATPSFLESLWASFNKTFIREERWRLFADGVWTTLIITLLAILFGTALGFVLFMLCRNGNPVANLITRFCLWLVQGMPMVVLLMILYYIVFGSVAISGIAVAVIGFTLTFGASVYGLLKMGVGAVDNGQYEAAYALGYSNRRTFFKIILPQALPHVLPAYKGEIVGLIKATAIVGYIAVQDLTKMGDIVRSRTYEAFFPLIAVTVIYFVLEGLGSFLVSRIGVNFNPKRRKPADILKGVKTDDQN